MLRRAEREDRARRHRPGTSRWAVSRCDARRRAAPRERRSSPMLRSANGSRFAEATGGSAARRAGDPAHEGARSGDWCTQAARRARSASTLRRCIRERSHAGSDGVSGACVLREASRTSRAKRAASRDIAAPARNRPTRSAGRSQTARRLPPREARRLRASPRTPVGGTHGRGSQGAIWVASWSSRRRSAPASRRFRSGTSEDSRGARDTTAARRRLLAGHAMESVDPAVRHRAARGGRLG